MATPEGEIVNAICEYLSYKTDLLFWRQNTAPVYDKTGGFFRAMPKYARKGIPDIIVIKAGKFIGIEVKTDTGKLSKEQAAFGVECVRNGGEYVVARCLDDVQAAGL